MKTHKFDVEDAKKYGIEKAILLEHLKFHQQANEGNPDLEIDGKAHAFIKPETIQKMYPYLSYGSVRRWLKELEDDGVIESCKPKAKGGYHLKYYHVKSIKNTNAQNEISNAQTDHSMNAQNEHSSILPNGIPYEGNSNIPSEKEVMHYFRERGDMLATDIPLEAENFINHYEDENWKTSKGKKITEWKRQASTWNNNYKKYNAKRLKENTNNQYKVIDGGTW